MNVRVKNVGFLIMDFSKGGGTERVTSVIANSLDKKRYKVTIISCQNGDLARFSINDGIEIISLHGERCTIGVHRKLYTYSKLVKVVKERNLDIIVAVDITLYLYLLPLQMKRRCKCIAWEHFNFFSQLESKERIVARKVSAKFADALIVLSDADLDNYKNNLKRIRNIRRIYNPVSIVPTGIANLNQKIFLSVGRLEEQKGYDILLNIWKDVQEKLPGWRLKIIGDGSKRENLEKYIAEYKIKNIELLPFSNNIVDEYFRASIYLMTSRFEGFGLVLTEAQSVGVPIITFDCPEGPREIVENGKAGILVPFLNNDLFKTEMLRLAENRELLLDIQKKELESSKKYNIDKIIREWDSIFEELV